MPNGREIRRSFRIQEGGRNMKRLITAVIIATCLALCAAVWPQAATVEETPMPTPAPAVTAPEPPATGVKFEAEIDPQQRKKKMRLHSQSLPMNLSMNRSLKPWKRLRLPKCSQRLSRNQRPNPPRRKRPQISSPATWSMWRASAGWSTRGRITANTVRTFMRTATRSASWVKT